MLRGRAKKEGREEERKREEGTEDRRKLGRVKERGEARRKYRAKGK